MKFWVKKSLFSILLGVGVMDSFLLALQIGDDEVNVSVLGVLGFQIVLLFIFGTVAIGLNSPEPTIGNCDKCCFRDSGVKEK